MPAHSQRSVHATWPAHPSGPTYDSDLTPEVVEGYEPKTPSTDSPAHLRGSYGTIIDSVTPLSRQSYNFLSPPQVAGEMGRIAGFRVLRKLGEGGMGMVFEAEDIQLGRRVALKVMKPEIASEEQHRARFIREARTAAAVEHDSICPIYQVGVDRGVVFIAMPFLKGETLDARLRRDKCLPVSEVIRIGCAVAEGLAAAHEAGLVHRDIKPANIWLVQKEEASAVDALNRTDGSGAIRHVKILDFGLARFTVSAKRLTQIGAVLGTPAYMAPEQAQGREVDHRADLFSLGIVLYEMATGRRPFDGGNIMSVLSSLALSEPPAPSAVNPAIPAELSSLIQRLLAKSPDKRPDDARTVARSLWGMLTLTARPALSSSDATNSTEFESAAAAGPAANLNGPAQPGVAPTVDRPKRKDLPWLAIAVGLHFLVVSIVALVVALKSQRKCNADASGRGTSAVNAVGGDAVVAKTNALPAAHLMSARAPFSADQAAALQEQWARATGAKIESTNSIGMKFRLIPSGEFARSSENQVVISKPFFMGAHEVTVGQFRAFVEEMRYQTIAEGGKNDRPFTWKHSEFASGDDYPVGRLAWFDAVEFCQWLSAKECKTYRLPTEAEWEWACRAGRAADDRFGDDAGGFGEYAWTSVNSGGRPHPVGQKKPNAWGLHDMQGNVAEHCLDWYADYPEGTIIDPRGPREGSSRVIRGLSYLERPSAEMANHRGQLDPKQSKPQLGMRIVCEESPE